MERTMTSSSDETAPPNYFAVSSASREALRSRIMECYRACNPEKVRSGEASRLVGKYRGQEALLLRRIQHKYALECLRGRAWVLRQRWEAVELRLAAGDGLLRCRFSPRRKKNRAAAEERRHDDPEDELIDAKMCLVEISDENEAGRHSRRATSPVPEMFGLVVASVGVSRLFRFATGAERDAWALELRKTRAFFERIDEERRVKAENERNHQLAVEASKASAQNDAERRRRAQDELAIEIARAAALSQLEDYYNDEEEDDEEEHPPPALASRSPSPPTAVAESATESPTRRRRHSDRLSVAALCASLEADVDEALVCTAQANDLAARNQSAAAFEAYLASVAAFVNVKVTVEKLPADRRPEPHVLALVDRGTRDCKKAAATLLDRKLGSPAEASSPGRDDANDANDDDEPPQQQQSAVPAAISKIIVDSDDL